jgi:hypothetical protein
MLKAQNNSDEEGREMRQTIALRESTLKYIAKQLDGRRKDLVTIRIDYPKVTFILDRTEDVIQVESH